MTFSIRFPSFDFSGIGAFVAAGLLTVTLSTPALSADTVTFRYLASQGGVSPHELAEELGYFKDLGIQLENVGYAQGGPASLFALAAGSVDLGSAATAAVINSIAGGNDFVAAYPSNGINDQVQSVFYVLEDSPIKSCLLYTSPSPRDGLLSRMPSSA